MLFWKYLVYVLGIRIALQNFHVLFMEFVEYDLNPELSENVLVPDRNFPLYLQFYFMTWTFRTTLHQCTVYGILSLTDSSPLTGDMILLCTNVVYLSHDSHSHFLKILVLVHCHPCPIWSVLPLHLTCIFVFLLKLLSVNLTFHVPNFLSVFQSWGQLFPNFFGSLSLGSINSCHCSLPYPVKGIFALTCGHQY
jgi:hypothetical protein